MGGGRGSGWWRGICVRWDGGLWGEWLVEHDVFLSVACFGLLFLWGKALYFLWGIDAKGIRDDLPSMRCGRARALCRCLCISDA